MISTLSEFRTLGFGFNPLEFWAPRVHSLLWMSPEGVPSPLPSSAAFSSDLLSQPPQAVLKDLSPEVFFSFPSAFFSLPDPGPFHVSA